MAKAKTRYPYIVIRTAEGPVRIHEDAFYDGLTSGPWRPAEDQAEVEYQ